MSQTFKEGDPVLVTEVSHRGARPEVIPAAIARAAGAWLTITTDEPHPREWRMRRDTQCGPIDYGFRYILGYSARFDVVPNRKAVA